MRTIYFVLYVLAAVCFVASAFVGYRARTTADGVRGGDHVSFVGLGLLFWVLVPLIQTARAL